MKLTNYLKSLFNLNFNSEFSKKTGFPLSLLVDNIGDKANRGDIRSNASLIEKTYESYGIQVRVVEVNAGSLFTQYCMKVEIGVTMPQILNYRNELTANLAAPSTVIIDAPIIGRDLVGINILNKVREYIPLKKMLLSSVFRKAAGKLPVTLGLELSGMPSILTLLDHPFVIIAGASGTGKTMILKTWILSLLYKHTPRKVKLLLIDPHGIELLGFNGIPHLTKPVLTDPESIIQTLQNVSEIIEKRLKTFREEGVTSIEQYHERNTHKSLPYIVILFDNYGSLTGESKHTVENLLFTIMQKGKLAGIILIITARSPYRELPYKIMNTHLPIHIALALPNSNESQAFSLPGAEDLIDHGDMLVKLDTHHEPIRVQGACVTDEEIMSVVNYYKKIQKQQTK